MKILLAFSMPLRMPRARTTRTTTHTPITGQATADPDRHPHPHTDQGPGHRRPVPRDPPGPFTDLKEIFEEEGVGVLTPLLADGKTHETQGPSNDHRIVDGDDEADRHLPPADGLSR